MTIAEFDPVQIGAIVALVGAVVQLIKKAFEKIEEWQSAPAWIRSIATWWAHGKGPAILSVLVALFVTLLPGIVEDGALSLPEVEQILQAVGLTFGSNILYWISRWKSPFKKKNA